MNKEAFIEALRKSNETYHLRICSIEFMNFRNIEHGQVVFPNSDFQAFRNGEPSILGLYGQNGSGKTSVIMALSLLKTILTGGSVDPFIFASCIRYGQERSRIKFVFSMMVITDKSKELSTALGQELFRFDKQTNYLVEYGFDLVREKQVGKNTAKGTVKLIVENEFIATKPISQDKGTPISKQVLFDTSYEVSDKIMHAFGNKAKFKLFVKNNKTTDLALNKLKAVTRAQGSSFLFSPLFLDELVKSPVMETYEKDLDATLEMASLASELYKKYNHFEDTDDISISDEELESLEKEFRKLSPGLQKAKELMTISSAFTILNWFPIFGKDYLHVIDTSITGITNQNKDLPLLLWNWSGNRLFSKTFMLNMNDSSEETEENYPYIKRAILAISKVLSTIVPGVSLQIVDGGIEKGNHKFEIESVRGDVHLPLKYESDGVRRIVSILSLLVAAYNQQTFTIAIDEIDSGIFEYLLGVILNLMGKTAKGQLIFTSHNLRPLEMLPDKFLCFTTVNPQNRFTSLKKRGNSNLRDCYFRSIVLGTSGDAVYNSTDQFDIEEAFLLAGKRDENV